MASSENSADIITEFNSISIGSYCATSAAALFIYDFIITIGDESKYFWSNRLTGAAALFYLNRSFAIVFYVLYVVLNATTLDSESCVASAKIIEATELLISVSPGVFTTLRMFALTQSWALALLIGFLAVVPTFGVNVATFGFGLTGVYLPVFGCTITHAVNLELAKTFTIVSRTSLITADSLAILVTWLKLWSRNTPGDRGPGEQATPGPHGLSKTNTFAHVLLRDGTVYFVAIGVLNCLQLIFTMLSFEIDSQQNDSSISVFVESLTVILVSRLLLHLQAVKARTSCAGSSQASSVFKFERVIGSLDASLSLEDYFEDAGAMELAATPEVSENPYSNDSSLEFELASTDRSRDRSPW